MSDLLPDTSFTYIVEYLGDYNQSGQSGEIFLDTDDIWLTDKLEKQIPLFADHDVGLVYGNCWLYNKKNLFLYNK